MTTTTNRLNNGPVPDRITYSKGEKKELKVIKENPTSRQLRQHERRKLVWHYMCMGFNNGQIADRLKVGTKTVAKDIKVILDAGNFEEEKKKLREKINWDLQQASANYKEAKDNGDKRGMKDWMFMRTRINQIQATYLKDTNITLIGKQENKQFIKADLSLILDGITQKRKEKLMI